ncbi:helix-turn-helix transcriptional regulator [Haemophilus influenzae]|uniref:Putative HTH-type transcriptional regulator n=1 Tax=Haemophilus influenzae TaxID=727 RepID=A0A0D0INQ4_HAEIF|nr:helix-turn-helix transcriptional regulator [Haemophilus influenzae]EDK09836.1 transcriptional activator-regulatory protein [Haemophilus influenzae PittHH]KIP36428.1 transcriptional regulator [Haemophilus influenzae]KIP50310.1 transcriptional regulator [Haemophilus influenzae]KIS35284.1 putative HTH-type transcriptional regulator [Haemophilus influenzae]KMZ33228.1 transcriptional regulator [Haemophilus influenzae]
MATLSERLTSLMYEKGISQAELARLIGIKQPSVFKILSGETRNPKKILEIATALNVDPHWLKTGEGDPDPSYRIVEVSEPQNPNTVRIDILDVEVSAGNGAYLSPTEQGLLSQEFDLTFFRQQFGRADAKHLKLITVKGDSMAPTLESGDLLYVDVSENYFSADGLYVFTFDDHTFIKRLQKRGREMWAISDNKEEYKEWEIKQDDPVFIHGRVVFSLPMKMKKW